MWRVVGSAWGDELVVLYEKEAEVEDRHIGIRIGRNERVQHNARDGELVLGGSVAVMIWTDHRESYSPHRQRR